MSSIQGSKKAAAKAARELVKELKKKDLQERQRKADLARSEFAKVSEEQVQPIVVPTKLSVIKAAKLLEKEKVRLAKEAKAKEKEFKTLQRVDKESRADRIDEIKKLRKSFNSDTPVPFDPTALEREKRREKSFSLFAKKHKKVFSEVGKKPLLIQPLVYKDRIIHEDDDLSLFISSVGEQPLISKFQDKSILPPVEEEESLHFVNKPKAPVSMFSYDPVEEKIDIKDVRKEIKGAPKKASVKVIMARVKRRQAAKRVEVVGQEAAHKVQKVSKGRARDDKIARMNSEVDQTFDFKNLKAPSKEKDPTRSRRGRVKVPPTHVNKFSRQEVWDHRKVQEQRRKDKAEAKKGSVVVTEAQSGKSWQPITDAANNLIGKDTTKFLMFVVGFIRLIRELSRDIPRSTKSTLLTFWIQNLSVGAIEANLIAEAVSVLISFAPSRKDLKDLPVGDGVVRTEAQALSDELDKMGDVLEYTFNSSFSTAVQTLLVYGTLTNLIPEGSKYPIHKWLGRPDSKLTLLFVVETSIKAAARIVKVIEMLADGKPWNEAILHRDPAVFHRMKANELLMQRDFLYSGIKVEGKYNRYLWLKEAKATIEYFQARLKVANSARGEHVELSRHLCALSSAYSSVHSTTNGGYRPMPFGIIIGDQPGIGKSRLIDVILAQWSTLCGMKYSPDMVFHVEPEQEFMEGLTDQIFYHYPELGTETIKIAQAKASPAIMAMTKVMDSQPTLVPKAFGEKGKVWMRPQVVICDTNNFTMNFDHMVCNPAAFRRRFLYVEFVVLPKYRAEIPGGTLACGLSGEKIRKDPPSNPCDIYEVNAWYNLAVDTVKSYRKDICTKVPIKEFLLVLRKEMCKHMQNQAYVQDSLPKFVNIMGDSEGKDLTDDNAFDETIATPVDGLVKGINDFARNLKDDVSSATLSLTDKLSKTFGAKSVVDGDMPRSREGMKFDLDESKDDILSERSVEDYSEDYDIEIDKLITEHTPSESDVKFLDAPDEIKSSLISPEPFIASGVNPFGATLADFGVEDVKTNTESKTWKSLQSKFDKKPDRNFDISRFSLRCCLAMDALSLSPSQTEACYDAMVMTGRIYETVNGESVLAVSRSVFPPELQDSDIKSTCQLFTKFTVIFMIELNNHIDLRPKMFNTISGTHRLPNSRLPTVDMDDGFFTCLKHDLQYYAHCGVAIFQEQFEWARATGPFVASAIPFSLAFFTSMLLYMFSGWFAPVIYSALYYGTWFTYCRKASTVRTWFLKKYAYKYFTNYTTLKRAGQALAVLTATAGMFQTVRVLWGSSKNRTTKTQNNEFLKYFEDRVDAGEGFSRKDTKGFKSQYERTVSVNNATSNTDSLAMSYASFTRNMRYVIVKYMDGLIQVNSTGYLYGIRGDMAVMPSHYFSKGDQWTLHVTTASSGMISEQTKLVELVREDIYFNRESDLAYFRTTGLQFKDVSDNFANANTHDAIGKGYFRGDSVQWEFGTISLAQNVDENQVVHYVHNPIRMWTHTKKGMCGSILVSQTVCSNYVAGIHVGGGSEGERPYGIIAVVTKIDIQRAMDFLSRVTVLAQSSSLPDEPTFVQLESDFKQSDLTEPKGKSPFLFEPFVNLEFLGNTGANVMGSQKSSLQKSIFCEDDQREEETVDMFIKTFGTIKTVYGRPMMQGKMIDGKWVSPYNLNLRKCNVQSMRFSPRLLKKVVKALSSRLISNLEIKGFRRMQPFSLATVINGGKADDFFDGIKLNTSAGFGFPGTKSRYVFQDEHGVRKLDPTVELALQRALDKLARRESPGFVHTVSLKDEPRALEKCRAGKTRCFFMTNLVNLVLARMFLGPLYSTMVSHCDAFYAAIGTDAHRDFSLLHKTLSDFSQEWMEGDYGGYDVSMPVDVAIVTNTVILEIFKHFGYNQDALLVTEGLLSESLHLTYEMCGDMYRVVGKQPSGKYGTAEDNSLRNLVLMLLAWFSTPELEGKDFFDNVKPLVYGDDMLAAVKKPVQDDFNNLTFSRFIGSIGMEFTTASKTQVESPFVTPDTASFLKRTFVIKPDLGKIVGPLDSDSIFKMIQWTAPSKVASPAIQMLGTISSCLRESFFILGKAQYTSWREYVRRVYVEKYGCTPALEDTHFHTYEKLLEEYGAKDVVVEAQASSSRHYKTSTPVAVGQVYKSNEDDALVTEVSRCIVKNFSSADVPHKEKFIVELQTEYKQASFELEQASNPFPGVSPCHYHLVETYYSSPETKRVADRYAKAYFRVLEIEETIKLMESSVTKTKLNVITYTQSDVIPVIGKGTVDEKTEDVHQNVTDVGGMESKDFSTGMSFDAANESDLAIGNFFMRPIEISVQTVGIGASYATVIEPYPVLFSDPSFRAKYRNYGYCRGNLKLRISVSASLNHFGRLLFAYVPMAKVNEVASFYATLNANYRGQLKMWLSQVEGCVVVDVADNEPIEMSCGYMSFNPMARLFNKSTTAIAGAIQDFELQGYFFTVALNAIGCVNNVSATGVTVQTYAWLEDVTLAQPTGTVVTVVTESNEIKQGVVQKTASTAADIAKALTLVPAIYPFAKASEIGFRSLAGIAALFGWSAPIMPPSEHMPMHVRPDAFQNAVTTITANTGKKMTFDPLQEVSVDPRIVGSTDDEMCVMAIARRWSLLTIVPWANADAPLSTLTWYGAVHPLMVTRGPVADSKAFFQPTSMGFAAHPFAYWHGSIEFKFEIVASRFHRGKIAVMFDPNISQFALLTSNLALNKQNTIIVDLQETNEFTVCVKWSRHRFWQKCNGSQQLTNQLVTPNFATTFAATSYEEFANGFVLVTPFTKLQSPDNSNVSINIYVRAGEDFAVNQLLVENLPTVRTTTQSSSDTNMNTCYELNEQVLDKTHKSVLHFGEQPVSFRSYLKRFYTSGAGSVISDDTGTYTWTGLFLPNNANPWGTAGGNPMDLMSWLRPSYIGYRGSVRKRLRVQGLLYSAGDHVKVYQNVPSNTPVATGFLDTGAATISHTGAATFVPFTNAGVEVEFPFYSNVLFWPSGTDTADDMAAIASQVWDPYQTYNYNAIFEITGNNFEHQVRLYEETAYGDDSSLIHYIAATPFVTTTY
nr:MAG: polyprotein [Marnaviridae sp.]